MTVSHITSNQRRQLKEQGVFFLPVMSGRPLRSTHSGKTHLDFHLKNSFLVFSGPSLFPMECLSENNI